MLDIIDTANFNSDSLVLLSIDSNLISSLNHGVLLVVIKYLSVNVYVCIHHKQVFINNNTAVSLLYNCKVEMVFGL